MKKTGLIFSAVLFSFFILQSSPAFADKGGHSDSYENDLSGDQKLEEGSGSSAVQSSMGTTEEYTSGHEEAGEEGSISYKRHRKEMKAKEKAMQESMPMPAGNSGKMEEGSRKK